MEQRLAKHGLVILRNQDNPESSKIPSNIQLALAIIKLLSTQSKEEVITEVEHLGITYNMPIYSDWFLLYALSGTLGVDIVLFSTRGKHQRWSGGPDCPCIALINDTESFMQNKRWHVIVKCP